MFSTQLINKTLSVKPNIFKMTRSICELRKTSNNVKNDTPLHHFMKECKDPLEIEYLLKTNCTTDITKMLLMVNNNGETPIDLLLDNYHFDNDAGWSTYNKLLNLIKENQEFKPLHEGVSLQELMPNNINDKELNVSLELACSVMNDTRHLMPFSFTHPSCNFYDLDQKGRVLDQICFLRNSIMSKYEQPVSTFSSIVFNACREMKVGNCFEFSYVSIEYLKKKTAQELWAGVVIIPNGDHTFTIWDSKPLMKLGDYMLKDSTAVFCDSWSGTAGAFNRHEITNKLRDHRYYDYNFEKLQFFRSSGVQANVFFNTEFHKLSLERHVHIIPKS